MQNQAASAYQKTGQQTTSPRDLEANLLSRSASTLQRLRDDWDSIPRLELNNALQFNRRLWTVFMTSVTRDDSPLPVDVRQNVANLGIFVMKHTIAILAEPKPEKISPLIDINRNLAAGLAGNA